MSSPSKNPPGRDDSSKNGSYQENMSDIYQRHISMLASLLRESTLLNAGCLLKNKATVTRRPAKWESTATHLLADVAQALAGTIVKCDL